MDGENGRQGGKAAKLVCRLANRTVAAVGALIFLYLSWYAFWTTQYMDPLGIELPFCVPDAKLQNLFILCAALLVMAGLLWLEGRISERARAWIARGSVMFAMVWIGIGAFWWIYSALRVPLADQADIYLNAGYFREGNFGSLLPGGYLDCYPRQLGLVALTELLYAVAGEYNYFAFEFMNAAMTPCIVLFGYLCVRELTDSMSAAVLYSLTMLGCLPMVFYTSWVYGEIPGIFFIMLGAALLFRFFHRGKPGWLIGGLLALTLAYLVRANALIMILAAIFALLGGALRHRKWKLLGAALCAALLPGLAFSGIKQIYQERSGVEKSEGMSTWSTIVLGVQESAGRYGWDHDNYAYRIYQSHNFDKEAAREEYLSDLGERLKVFREDPGYALHFYREKMLSQWNEPLHQALYFSVNYPQGERPAEDSFVYRLNTDLFLPLLRICDRLQSVLYLGMLLYFVCCVHKEDDLFRHMLAVAVIGGFFFSALWEAKARYIFPYFIMMFPVAALGYRGFVLSAKGRLGALRLGMRERQTRGEQNSGLH